jgi:hypothetical protein
MPRNRIVAAWLLCVLSTGCAAHQAPPPRTISTAWRTVEALKPGTEVGVRLDNGEVRNGRVREVSAQALTLWERKGAAVIPRAGIERLATRRAIGTTKWPNVVAGALIGLAITAIPAYIAFGIDENGSSSGREFALLFLGPAIGAALGSQAAPSERFREQIIYIRPGGVTSGPGPGGSRSSARSIDRREPSSPDPRRSSACGSDRPSGRRACPARRAC